MYQKQIVFGGCADNRDAPNAPLIRVAAITYLMVLKLTFISVLSFLKNNFARVRENVHINYLLNS